MMSGYTHGQYMGRNTLTLAAEDRYMLRPKIGVIVEFAKGNGAIRFLSAFGNRF